MKSLLTQRFKRSTAVRPDQVQFKTYDHDSLFKDEIAQEQVNLGLNSNPASKGGCSWIIVFPTLKRNGYGKI